MAFAESQTWSRCVRGEFGREARSRIEGGGRGLRDGEKASKLDGRESPGAIKAQVKSIERWCNRQ